MRHRVLGATIFFVAFLLFAVKADDSEGDVSNPEVFTESDLVIVGKVVAIHENQKALRVVPRRSPQIVVYEVRRVLRGRCSLERIVVHRGLAAEMKTGDLHVLACACAPSPATPSATCMPTDSWARRLCPCPRPPRTSRPSRSSSSRAGGTESL